MTKHIFNPNAGMVIIRLEEAKQNSIVFDPSRTGDDKYGEIVAVGPVADGLPCLYGPGDRVLIPPRGQRFPYDGVNYTAVFHLDIPTSVAKEEEAL